MTGTIDGRYDVPVEGWPPEDPVRTLREFLAERYADHPESEVLLDRLDEQLPALWTAFTEVYGDDRESVMWLLEAVEAAVEAFESRPERLRSLDRSRKGVDDWFQGPGEVGYMCYVDLFAGDLQGVREKIPYLKELGVTYLHLMPLLEPREGRNDGGYAVKDYRSVDPDLGAMDDLRELATDLQEEGIRLALDFVMNHTAREHEWAQAAINGDDRFQDFYLTYEDRELPDQYEQTVPEVFPDFAPGNFTYVDELEQWVWTSFYDFQWDLDYTNPDVFVQMFREMAFLANVGTDILRLDAVPFLWKELGTDCRNLDEAHWILRAYRALMRIAAPGVLFKAEAIVAPEETIKYLGTGGHEGEECDIAYNAPLMAHLWHALASENTQLLERALEELPPTPEEASWLNYVRCHDDIGWGLDDEDVRAVGQDPVSTRKFCSDFYAGDHPDSYAEGYRFQEEPTGVARTSGTAAALTGVQKARVSGDQAEVDWAIQRFLLMHAAVFAMQGMPLLYSGDEIGQLNDFSYLNNPSKEDDNRWIHRSLMDWEAAERRSLPGSVEQRIFDAISRLTEVRSGREALHHRAEESVLDIDNDQVFAVERVRGEDRLLAVSNFSDETQAIPFSDLPEPWGAGGYHEVLRDGPAFYPDGRLLLEPYGYRWLEPDPDSTPGETLTTHVEIDVEAEWGQELFLTGDHEALGNWDVGQAVPLSGADYPTWKTDFDLQEGTYVEFEWLKKRDNEPVEWSGHRYFTKAGWDQAWLL
ncbi:MAG: alpha-amylase family glycosyl hydrolase [Halapricum sp.]